MAEAAAVQNDICRIIYKMCSAHGNLYAVVKAILKKHGERTEMRYEAPVLSPNMPPIPLSTAPLEIPTRCGGVVLFVLDVAQSARY